MRTENLNIDRQEISKQKLAEEIALLAIEKRAMMTVVQELKTECGKLELTIKTITEKPEKQESV